MHYNKSINKRKEVNKVTTLTEVLDLFKNNKVGIRFQEKGKKSKYKDLKEWSKGALDNYEILTLSGGVCDTIWVTLQAK